MDKTLIKLKAIKKTYEPEGFSSLIKMIDEIIEEVEFKNTVLQAIASWEIKKSDSGGLIIQHKDKGFIVVNGGLRESIAHNILFKLASDLIATPEKGTREALDKLTVRGE